MLVTVLVLFDLDNTLGDRAAAVRHWAIDFAARHGLGAEAVDWFLAADRDGYRDRHEVFTDFRGEFGLDSAVDTLLDDYRRSVVELTRTTLGAAACLLELREQGAALAIVTNGSSGQQHAKIDRLGLRPLVDAVVVSGDLGIKKPDPRIFEAAAAAVGHGLDDAWMVGDAVEHDIVSASALGLRTAWMHRNRVWPHPEVPPTAIIGTLRELPAHVFG